MFALNRLRPLLRVTLRALLLLTTLSNPILATVGDLHDTFGVIDKVHPGAISTSTAASAVGAEEHDGRNKYFVIMQLTSGAVKRGPEGDVERS